MKIFVAGRDGQVARCLRDVAGPDIDLVAMGRPEFDVRDANVVAHCIGRHRPDVVINAAAYTQVDRAENDEAAAFAVNAQGAANIADACANLDIPLIQLSTDYVFDGEQGAPYRESDPTRPISVYGRSKLEGEHRVAARCPKHLIVRTSWVFSPYGSNFVLTMLRLAQSRSTLDVVDDQFGAPTYAPDLAEALLSLAKHATSKAGPESRGVLHATASGETSWYGFAQAIFAEARVFHLPAATVRPIRAADYPAAAKRPRNSRLDCGKLHATLALALPEWQSGMRRALARVAQGSHAP